MYLLNAVTTRLAKSGIEKWYIDVNRIHLIRVEQAVVYSTLPQEYSTLTFRGEVVAGDGGVEERSEVMYWHRGAYIIYYRDITCHSYIA